MKVLIGIQARLGSTRCPGKILEKIGPHMIVEKVLRTAYETADFLQRDRKLEPLEVSVRLLIPDHDEELYQMMEGRKIEYTINLGYKTLYKRKYIQTIRGPEQDVLTRYMLAMKEEKADYVVRITSDCDEMPSYMPSRHLRSALKEKTDYTQNVIPTIRTAKEGYDTEVMSAKMMHWLDENATTKEHREHVTLAGIDYVLKNPDQFPDNAPFTVCSIIEHSDDSNVKTSKDTMAEIEVGRDNYFSKQEKIRVAKGYGKVNGD